MSRITSCDRVHLPLDEILFRVLDNEMMLLHNTVPHTRGVTSNTIHEEAPVRPIIQTLLFNFTLRSTSLNASTSLKAVHGSPSRYIIISCFVPIATIYVHTLSVRLFASTNLSHF